MIAQHDHRNLGGSSRWLDLAAAELLAIDNPRKLRDCWKRWGIPAYKAGRELRFRERDLHAWLAKRDA